MKENERLEGKRGIAPVISALILSAVVIVVGGVVWAYSQGAMTITAEDYAESVIEMTDTISERFIVEHVVYDEDGLRVWIYNYGAVDIEVKIEVGGVTYPEEWVEIQEGGFAELAPLSYTMGSGEELLIVAYTKRGNHAYYKYIVP